MLFFFLLDSQTFESPIVLQDPPKAKLKRQLSINTVQQSESLRSYKRQATTDQPSNTDKSSPHSDDEDVGLVYSRYRHHEESDSSYMSRLRPAANDEVDGSCTLDAYTSRGLSGRARISTELNKIDDFAQGASNYKHVPSIYNSPDDEAQESPFDPLPSPNRFNLGDIGLTSPFMSKSTDNRALKDDVFVFPDSTAPRKVSPYKSSPSKVEQFENSVKEVYTRQPYGAKNESLDREDIFGRHSKERGRPSVQHEGDFPKYICPEKGFRWPKKVSISDPPDFSPRIVTTDSRPRFPTSTATSERYNIDEDKANLRILQREAQRARKIFGSPPSQSEIRDYQVKATKRAISDIARSPNEKEKNELKDEARALYERSYSDPRASPHQLRTILQRPSPLARGQSSNTRVPTETLSDNMVKSKMLKKSFLIFSFLTQLHHNY